MLSMDSSKTAFGQRLQAHKYSSDSGGEDDELFESGGSENNVEDASSTSEEEEYVASLKNISFGTLAAADQSLGKRKRTASVPTNDDSTRLAALRARLHELREQKSKSLSSRTTDGLEEEEEEEEEEESAVDERQTKRKKPSSHHAPTVQSSKRPVSRRRQIIEPSKTTKPLDPRFNPLTGPAPTPDTMNKKYGFLKDYRASELVQLQTALKSTRDADERARLSKVIKRMTSQRRAAEQKQAERSIMQKHKAEERTRVKDGKKPYFLKKKDVKKLVLMEKFKGMGDGEVDRALERRRKKRAAKERRLMPAARRNIRE